jgi:hypothetical protein
MITTIVAIMWPPSAAVRDGVPTGEYARNPGHGPPADDFTCIAADDPRPPNAVRLVRLAVSLPPVQVGSSSAVRLLDSHRLKSAVLQLR